MKINLPGWGKKITFWWENYSKHIAFAEGCERRRCSTLC
jgi:hypothetical protein